MNNLQRPLPSFSLAMALFLASAAPSTEALMITPSATEVAAGATFELRFSDDFTNFFGAIIDATSSPTSGALLLGLAPGAGLPAGASVSSPLPTVVGTPTAVSGTALEFLVITYRATAPGDLLWNFEGTWDEELAPGSYDTHTFAPTGVSVRVTGQAVPEGSILALFGLGIPLLARFTRTARHAPNRAGRAGADTVGFPGLRRSSPEPSTLTGQ